MAIGWTRRRIRTTILLYLAIGVIEVGFVNARNPDPDGRLTLGMLMDPAVHPEYKAVVLLGSAGLALAWPLTLPFVIRRWVL